MDFYRHLVRGSGVGRPVTFALLYALSIVFTIQHLLTAYSSSTYLELFLPEHLVGFVFSLGAAGAAILTLLLPRILQPLGNVATVLLLMLIITIALLLTGLAPTAEIALIAFVIYLITSPQIYLNIDVFMEALIGNNEGTTGSRRGLILTIMSTAAFFSPLLMGFIIGTENRLDALYYASAAIGLLFIALIIARFRHFSDPPYKATTLRSMALEIKNNSNIKTVLTSHFLLQLFYAWAVIYIPLFLATELGFSWQNEISLIIAAGLLAFALFEYPIGLLADRHWGEKEMMAVGFVVLALSTATISLMTGAGVLGWMILMFISRFGASLVEVTTESYFFKQTQGDQPHLMSLFRLMRPLANLAGATLGSLSLWLLPFEYIFLVLAAVMALGVFITQALVDTK